MFANIVNVLLCISLLETIPMNAAQNIAIYNRPRLYPNATYEEYLESWTGHTCGGIHFCSKDKKDLYRACGHKYGIKCSMCECKDSCVGSGDCCIERRINESFTKLDLTEYVSCMRLPHKSMLSTTELGKKAMLVTRCPPDADLRLIHNCSATEPDDDIIIPVHDPVSQLDFRNTYCAQCHNISNVTRWDIQIGCTWSLSHKRAMRQATSIIRYVMSSDSCEFTVPFTGISCMYIPPAKVVISTCNTTGQWITYNRYMERGCGAYTSPMTVRGVFYGNIFCAQCNGIDLDSKTWRRCGFSRNTKIMQFSALFNFNPVSVTIVTEEQEVVECPTDQVYHPYMAACTTFHCSDARDPINHTCTPSFLSAHGIPYTFNMYLHPYNLTYKTFNKNTLKTLLWREFFFATYWQANISIYKLTDTIVGVHIRFYYLHYTFSTTQTQLELQLLKFMTSSLNLSDTKIFVPTNKEFFLRDYGYGDLTVRMVAIGSEGKTIPPIYKTEKAYIPVTYLLVCPQLKYNSSEYVIDYHNKTMTLSATQEVFTEFEFIINKQPASPGETVNTLIVCSTFNGTYTISTQSNIITSASVSDWETITTIVCTSVSMVFLVLTVIIYTTVPIPRGIPWQNNISMFTNILLAQFWFLMGSAQGGDLLCQIVGVLIHYFWLAVFCWKSVCAYHMYQLFTKPQESASKFTKFLIYAQLVPVVIITASILTKLSLSSWSDIGYGGTTCFINTPLMIGMTFALPVGIIIVVNGVFLGLVIRSISKLTEFQLNSNQTNRNYTAMYIKLSMILGFPWLVGFIAGAVQVEVLWVVFTVLNACPGVGIFVCFVCTKGTLNKCRRRYCGGGGGAERSHSTVMTSASVKYNHSTVTTSTKY